MSLTLSRAPSKVVLRASLLALSFALPLGLTTLAHADVACGDKTCPQNYECKDFPAACPAVACVGKDCADATCDTTVKDCSPLPCASDSECADGMVCYTETLSDCTSVTPTCPAGSDCPAPAAGDAACQPVTYSGCVPQYLVPCNVDADCGSGFNCQVEQECTCGGSSGSAPSSGSASGSAGSSDGGGSPTPPDAADAGAEKPAPDDGGAGDPLPAADSGAAPTPPDVPPSDGGCTCAPSTTKACNLKVIACSVDQGCQPGWTCGPNPNGDCFASSDGTTGCTADPPLICLPPYFDLGLSYAKGEDASGSGTTTGLGSAGAPSGEPPTANHGGSSAGASSGASKASSNGESEDNGGCAVGHARGPLGASLGFAALAFLGLFGARRRRAR